MQDLISFLGVPEHGAVVLEFVPDAPPGPTRYGVFTDAVALSATVGDYANQGSLRLRAQPLALGGDAASNRLNLLEAPPAAAGADNRFCTVVLRMYKPDDGEADSSTVACAFAARAGAGCVWQAHDESCYVLAAVPPFESPPELPEELSRFAAAVRREIVGVWPDAVVDVADRIVVPGKALRAGPRVERKKLARMLHRPIPPVIYRELTRRASSLSKLFNGKGGCGHDEHGKKLDETPENYDRAFVDALIEKGFHDERQLADALWNRPGGAARAQGPDAVLRVVHAAIDRMAVPTGATAAGGADADAAYPPETPLKKRLAAVYMEFSDRAGRWVWKIDADITVKAGHVVQFLMDNNAEFYYFASSSETVFVVGGVQHLVDIRDPAYQRWFTTNVALFGPSTARGKELTDALRVAVQQHEKCHKPTRAHWGYFDHPKATIYLCLDPDHARIVRIAPAGADGKPNVTVLPNGTDGVTLRGPLNRTRRFKYVADALPDGWVAYRDDVHRGQALTERDRLMSTAFNLTTLIPDHAQRPLKFHRGGQQSGKTSAAKEWEIVLYGRAALADYNDKQSLLHNIKCGGPIITIDNLEATTRRKFAQVFLVASTGASHTLRKYYHESMPVVFEPNGTLCLTAIEPMVKPEELRRTFEFEFNADKWGDDQARNQDTREARLHADSDKLLSALLDVFSVYVLPAYASGAYEDAVSWLQQHHLGSKRAFVSWLGWMHLINRTVGSYLWDGKRAYDPDAIMLEYIRDILASERSARIDGDTALSCLDQIRDDARIDVRFKALELPATVVVHTVPATVYPDGIIELGPLTTSDLFKAMSSVAKRHGIRFTYEHGRALGARMAVLAGDEAFSEMGWSRTKDHVKAHGNNYRYIYTWSNPEPQDDLWVDDDL